jgi:adenine deaminase
MQNYLLSLLIVLILLPPVSAQKNYDVILRNGTILNSTGAKGLRADIAIRNGFIHRLGTLRGVRATVELDVSGLIVAPASSICTATRLRQACAPP